MDRGAARRGRRAGLITNGSLQADAFIFGHLVSPGDDVIVEKPTYDRTLLNLRTMGAKIHQVSLDQDGLDVAELRKLLEAGVRPKLAHVIPNFQNPAG
jgi:DNA-binding transcriptional MocR family regulator